MANKLGFEQEPLYAYVDYQYIEFSLVEKGGYEIQMKSKDSEEKDRGYIEIDITNGQDIEA